MTAAPAARTSGALRTMGLWTSMVAAMATIEPNNPSRAMIARITAATMTPAGFRILLPEPRLPNILPIGGIVLKTAFKRQAIAYTLLSEYSREEPDALSGTESSS